MIYCSEMNVRPEEEFIESNEINSIHSLGFIGNAPVLVARHRVSQSSQASLCLIIDRIAVISVHRKQNLAKACLRYIMESIKSSYLLPVTEVIFIVKADNVCVPKLLSVGFTLHAVNHTPYSSIRERYSNQSLVNLTYSGDISQLMKCV